MLEARARWIKPEIDEDAAARLAAALNIHPLTARLLAVRGIVDPGEAALFLGAGAEGFHDPFLLKGMDEAVSRIRLALERKEKIRIYGDYDADGVSSTTLMTFLMRRLQAEFDTYIPHRVHEGYGLNREALEHAKRSGVTLVITVDTGISAKDEVAYAAELGLDVVVTDHHEPPEELPAAAAVINPKQPGCPYPFKLLAGVGVAFKLSHALLGEAPLEWLEIAAIGTVADLMPLTDENRWIVKLGLERLRNTGSPGLNALFSVAGIERKDLNEQHIGFRLAPRINASGRLDHADSALRLLTTEDEQEAELLACNLDALNKERQKIVDDMTKQALHMMKEKGFDTPDRRTVVLASEGWNVGVVGIVASKIVEKYYRPAILLAIDPETGIAKGSARSIEGFDIYEALTACGDLFDHFGGHQAAAGMSLAADKVPELAARLEQLGHELLSEEDLVPILQADLACSLADARLETIGQISQLAPFGMGNPQPMIMFHKLKVQEKRTMGKENQHLKLLLASGEAETACSMEAVSFGSGMLAERIAPTARVDVLGELSVNEWNGVQRPQIMIQDLRIPDAQVFDWRGGKQTAARYAGEMHEFGIVIHDRKESVMVPKEWLERGASLWLAQEAGLPQALEAATSIRTFGELRDVVFYSLPPHLGCLHEALRFASAAERLYAVFTDADEGSAGSVPDRESFKIMYAVLSRETDWNIRDDRALQSLAKRTGLSRQTVRFVLDVFEELEFIVCEGGNAWRLDRTAAKRELSESVRYRRMLNRGETEQALIYTSSLELTGYMLSYLPQATNH